MEPLFTDIYYSSTDLKLIKEAKPLRVQEQEPLHVQEQEQEPLRVQEQEQEPLHVQEQEKKSKIFLNFSIENRVDLDILNKTVNKNSLKDIKIDFVDDNTILINNSELSIPFQITYFMIETEDGRCIYSWETVDSINFIQKIIHNKTTYIIKINSNKYRDYQITDNKYMKNVDKYYDFIDKYKNRDKKILTEADILKKEKYDKLNIGINMSNDDIENFIDELCDEIDFKNLQFDIKIWKKKDYIILRTLNDLLIALFKNIINGFNNLCKYEQLKIVKYLINMYIKYHNNIVFLTKCSIGNNDLYITITAKLFEFYTIDHIFESILCFIKYAPEYCNENYYPVPQKGKIAITGEHEMEILNNKYLRDIYLENKHYLIS
jgi:hypothetical protein